MDSIWVREKKKGKKNSNVESHSQSQSQDAEESMMGSKMESLGDELIMEVLSRVPTPCLANLRYVCKRWNNILKDPLFRRLHCSHSSSKLKENRVLLLKRECELYWVDLTDYKRSPIDLPIIPNFSRYEFIGSCNGLICLAARMHSSSILIVNPFTRHKVLIPMPIKLEYQSPCGLGFDETTKLYKLVIVANGEVNICDLGIGGSTNWRKIGTTTTLHSSSHPACFLNRRLHWAHRTSHMFGFSIMSFDLADEKFTPIPTPDCLSRVVFGLIVLGGFLGIFHYQFHNAMKLQIWIMKEYGVKASWVKELDIQPEIPRSLNLSEGRNVLNVLAFVKEGELLASNFNTKTLEEAILFSSGSTSDELRYLLVERLPHMNQWIIHTASLI